MKNVFGQLTTKNTKFKLDDTQKNRSRGGRESAKSSKVLLMDTNNGSDALNESRRLGRKSGKRGYVVRVT